MIDTERLQKIVMMLSASTPGEVYNAVQLLKRILAENGFDWYDFAAKVSKEFKGINESSAQETPQPKKPKKNKNNDVWYRSRNGNLVGTIHGQKCTIFEDQYNIGEYVAVISTEDGRHWERGFDSEESAKEFMMEQY
jgi:hypothetical protein